ncbi:MAG TPA: aldehyde dehydrogenase family protein, partial [Phycisphaerales bacterium]|nr:aldehyde dehydrogenase family protein [Phycisphaerales bacterium]
MTEGLSHEASDYIGGKFVRLTGEGIQTRDPARPERIVWRGTPAIGHVDEAIAAARKAQQVWMRTPMDFRERLLRAWASATTRNVERVAGLITDEMGKTIAESTGEAKLLAEKVELALSGVSKSRTEEFEVTAGATRAGFCKFKPHGVMAVIGPFNFPAHLANGHWIPALLMGNAVVFKPSEKTAGVGQLMGE